MTISPEQVHKFELLQKASRVATEQVNEEMIFLGPEVYWELNEPLGSLECYFYYEDEQRNTREIIVQLLVDGTVLEISSKLLSLPGKTLNKRLG
ncbi:MAG: hypothetical protein ACXAEU_05640 [Candidatus Hodarchaeales archaeon]